MTGPRDGRLEPPSTVRLGVDLVWISIAVTIVTVALMVFGLGDGTTAAAAGVDDLAAEALLVDTSPGAMVSIGIVLVVIATLAVRMRMGARWAHVVYTSWPA